MDDKQFDAASSLFVKLTAKQADKPVDNEASRVGTSAWIGWQQPPATKNVGADATGRMCGDVRVTGDGAVKEAAPLAATLLGGLAGGGLAAKSMYDKVRPQAGGKSDMQVQQDQQARGEAEMAENRGEPAPEQGHISRLMSQFSNAAAEHPGAAAAGAGVSGAAAGVMAAQVAADKLLPIISYLRGVQ